VEGGHQQCLNQCIPRHLRLLLTEARANKSDAISAVNSVNQGVINFKISAKRCFQVFKHLGSDTSTFIGSGCVSP
jgi:hypothetical protein